MNATAIERLTVYDHPEIQRDFVVPRDEDGRPEAALLIEGVHCGGCVRRCEQALAKVAGVIDFQVNLATRRARLVWDPAVVRLSVLLERLAEAGYPAWPYDPRRQELGYRRERNHALQRLAVAGFGMMQVMMFAVALYTGADMDEGMRRFLRWMSLIMATPVVLYSARPFFANAWSGLRNRQPGMDLPVSIAIGGAYLASVWATLAGSGEVYFDSVTMFTFLLLLGRFLEMSARHRAAAAGEDLTRMLPALATRLDAAGDTREVPVAELVRGDRVLVRPGESIPADGVIEAGISAIDESLITGESLPCTKRPGERVIGGTLNSESPLTVVIDRVGPDTVLAAMNRLLSRAQLEKPHLARLADRVAGWFVVALLLVATVVYLWWARHAPADAFWITLSVLVVTCPCALSLATPTALTAATGALTRAGLLVTRGHALETLARVDHVIFDKTGTLTHGRLQLGAVDVYGALSAERCLAIAAALERQSEHPIARALVAGTEERLTASDPRATPGFGLEGSVDGRRYRVGSPAYAAEPGGGVVPDYDNPGGASVAALGDESGVLALFHLTDTPRDEARAAVAELRELGCTVEILSGDSPAAVARVAGELGIEQWHGGLTPDGKLARLTGLQERGRVVLMVGDGVNDSPVLARAQVSVAMGGGTELARSHADLVLLGERLDRLPTALRLGRRTLTVIRQNLGWALGYNAVALPLAAGGLIAPWMAAIGMSASSLIVVLNALRLSRVAVCRPVVEPVTTDRGTLTEPLA